MDCVREICTNRISLSITLFTYFNISLLRSQQLLVHTQHTYLVIHIQYTFQSKCSKILNDTQSKLTISFSMLKNLLPAEVDLRPGLLGNFGCRCRLPDFCKHLSY